MAKSKRKHSHRQSYLVWAEFHHFLKSYPKWEKVVMLPILHEIWLTYYPHLGPGNQSRVMFTDISISIEKVQVTMIRLHSLNSPGVSTEVHAQSNTVGTLLPQHSTLSFRGIAEAGKLLCLVSAVHSEENHLAHFYMKQIITPREVILPWSPEDLCVTGILPCIQR